MRFRPFRATTSILLPVVSAATSTVLDQLPACWQDCIEKRVSHCDSTDLNCLCHLAATPTLLPTLLTCVRRTCDTTYYPEFLTAPLQAVQTACGGTQYRISDAAVSKADDAAQSAYSAAVSAEGGGRDSARRTRTTGRRYAETTAEASRTSRSVSAETGGRESATKTRATRSRDAGTATAKTLGVSTSVSPEAGGRESATRTRATKSRDAETTAKALRTSISVRASTTGVSRSLRTTISTTAASSSAASGGLTTGASTASGPFTMSSASLVLSASTSTAHTSGDGGGTPLDVGEQGAASVKKKRAGSLLGLAIAFVVGLWF